MATMQVTAGDKIFEIDAAEFDTVTGYKELAAIERAFGRPFEQMQGLQAAGAIVWTLVKRQDPTVRLDDIDFDVTQIPNGDDDEAAPVDPTDSSPTDSAT